MVINDLDEDGFPEVITSNYDDMNENLSYKEGLHSFQFDDHGNVTHTIPDLPQGGEQFIPDSLIDLDEDIDMDMVISGTSIMNVENGSITKNWTGTLFNGSVSMSYTSDIDCDGDYDLAGNSRLSNILLTRMEDNGSFNGTGWDEGIPRKPTDQNSPRYISRDHKIEDINNDGWPDICSAMGNGGSFWNDGACQFYNWVSNGKGNWSDFSRGFPKYRMGLNLELADIDNDMDLDYALITDNGRYLYENINGTSWKMRKFPTTLTFDDFLFDDINEDGFQDMIYYYHTDIKDSVGNLIDQNTTLWISYGYGNFTWTNVKQFECRGGLSLYPKIVDMDRDGDKDIVLLRSFYYNYWTYHGNILFCENRMTGSENITIVDRPLSSHLRSGSIHHLSWTMINASHNMDQTFKISISYTGKYGNYTPFMNDLKMWWTNIIIPDIPTKNMFLRIEGGGYSQTIGPYAIHNSEDRSTLTRLVYPFEGETLLSGDEVELVINTSTHCPKGPARIEIIHENGTVDAGEHILFPGKNNSVRFHIDEEIFELDCKVRLTYQWRGDTIHQLLDDRIDIVSKSEIPENISNDEFDLPCGVIQKIDLYVHSHDGNNLTDLCSYDVEFDESVMDVTPKGKGSFSVKIFHLGSFSMKLVVGRFGHSRIWNVTLRGRFPLSSIEITHDPNPVVVGDLVDIQINGMDYLGDPIPLNLTDMNWTIDGDCEIIWSSEGLSIQSLTPGPILISTGIDYGLGTVVSEVVVNVKEAIETAKIRIDRICMIDGTEQFCFLDITATNEDLIDRFDIEWSVNENGSIDIIEKDRISLKAISPGDLNLKAMITYYNETVTLNKVIKVMPGLSGILVDKEVNLEVGTEFILNYSIIGTDGREIDENITFSAYCLNSSTAIVTRAGSFIQITGLKSGVTSLRMEAILGNTNISRILSVIVEGIPRSIEIELPALVQKDELFEAAYIAYDRVGDPVSGGGWVVETDLETLGSGEDIHYMGGSIGGKYFRVLFTKDGYSISKTISLFVVPNAVVIEPKDHEFVFMAGDEGEIGFYLVDNEGIALDNITWNITSSIGLNYTRYDNMIKIQAGAIGVYYLKLKVDYHGEIFFSNLTVEVIDPVRLSSYRFLDIGGGMIEVLALDQFENDITSLCNITWTGDFQKVDRYRVIPGEYGVDLEVSFNGTTLNGSYKPGMEPEMGGEDGSSPDTNIFILVSLTVLIASIISVMIFIYMKRRGKKQNSLVEE